jgi:hypothetical protein
MNSLEMHAGFGDVANAGREVETNPPSVAAYPALHSQHLTYALPALCRV